MEEVSIPYSSGLSFRYLNISGDVYADANGLNPLFIRSQFQMYSDDIDYYQKVNVSIPYSSGLSFRYYLFGDAIESLDYCLNPLFIRSQFQII